MGIYSEYLGKGMSPADLERERKLQLQRISVLRGGRDVLVCAANMQRQILLPIQINQADLLPINDQLANLKGTALDLILETPGGSGEAAEDLVKLIRSRYSQLGVIVPGVAKSAGTIIAMAADEILMEPASSLGPIDAQIIWQGKIFSAAALLDQMEKIKAEVEATGRLNLAYVPILQGISPGELQHAENALDFARDLVSDWLARYKFANWNARETSGEAVTPEFRRQRAKEIAVQLADHSRWKTHGRSIKIDDLLAMKLRITDYSGNADLRDAVTRYYTRLQLTFESNVYKLYETPSSQILKIERKEAGLSPVAPLSPKQVQRADIAVMCKKCGTQMILHAPFIKGVKVPDGQTPFPADNKITCPTCGSQHDLTAARKQIEQQGPPCGSSDGRRDMSRFDIVFEKLPHPVLIDSDTVRVTLIGTDDGAMSDIEAIREFAASLTDEHEPRTATVDHAGTADVELRGLTW